MNILSERFPSNYEDDDQKNPAINLYGRRFYTGQPHLEYLAEFLLVFASAKSSYKQDQFRFAVHSSPESKATYYPKDRVALKLFAFFSTSKLATRHPIHRSVYQDILEKIKFNTSGNISDTEKNDILRLLQSLFSGFVGISKNRTWVTCSFLPAASDLLAREITWNHPKALNNSNIKDWDDSRSFFDRSTHNFYGRGGELLFLQLANLFSQETLPLAHNQSKEYAHLAHISKTDLRDSIEKNLKYVLTDSISKINKIVRFIEKSLSEYTFNPEDKETRLGWVPACTLPESQLFAYEINNICQSNTDSLEKINLLQILCIMQVLRSLCFQAVRIDESVTITKGFIGNYAWLTSNPEAKSGDPSRKLSERSVSLIESMLYRVMRSEKLSKYYKNRNQEKIQKAIKNGDEHCFKHFRKSSKEIGIVIPRTGAGARFVLPPHLLRFLVAALLAPGERIRLTKFYERVFAHYGIALGDIQIATAMAWNGNHTDRHNYAVATDTTWIEETLQQGGLLVELSDAVSIVHNPGS